MNKKTDTFNNDTKIEKSFTFNWEGSDINPVDLDELTSDRVPLLPRSAWQDRKIFLGTLIKTKRFLDLAEITILCK